MKRTFVLELISFLFMVLFVYAAGNKLQDYQKFTVQIGQSPLLTGFGGTLPWIVIALELIISILLMMPRWRLVAFFAAFSLMTMFTAYIYAILHYSPYIPCSCGGVLENLSWREHLLFNSLFVLAAAAGIILQTRTLREAGKQSELVNKTQPVWPHD